MTKDSGLRIRIEKSLREAFLEVCKSQDKPAAQVIREFMRDYIKEYEQDKDSDKKRDSGQRDKQGG